MWIDSHCHLNHEKVADSDDPRLLVERSRRADVDGMLSVCCNISNEFDELLSMVQGLENVWCSIGTHPHDAALPSEKAFTTQEICTKANSSDKVIAIGECGLDYYYDNSPREEQISSFRKHIRASIESGLPLIVHSRDAEEDTAQILREEASNASAGKSLKGVMHCFSSGPQLAKDALDLGFYISFSGIVTFKKASELREIAKTVPSERIMIETDSPFLAPVPMRGKTNEPAFVTYTGEFMADLLDIDVNEFAAITKQNFFKLFDKAKVTYSK